MKRELELGDKQRGGVGRKRENEGTLVRCCLFEEKMENFRGAAPTSVVSLYGSYTVLPWTLQSPECTGKP